MAEKGAAFSISILYSDLAVFVLCEAIGLPFCYSGADAMLNGFYVRGAMGFAVGLPFGALGVVWLVLRDKFGPQIQELVRTAVLDMRIWMIALVLLFFWISVPTIRTDHQLLVSVAKEIGEFQKEMNRYVLPRHLTTQQAKAISDYLSKYDSKQMTVCVSPGSEEQTEYALDFWNAFKAGGWKVTLDTSGKPLNGQPITEGISWHFRGANSPQVEADTKHPTVDALMQKALEAAHIQVDGSSSGGSDKGAGTYTLWLDVGGRRMDDGDVKAKQQEIEELRKLTQDQDNSDVEK